MRSILKYISFIFLLILVISCEGVSNLLTTNYFEPFEDVNPFSVFIGDDETSFYDDFTPEEREALIDEYTAAALSYENEDALYESLIEQPNYRDEVTKYLKEYLESSENIPDIFSPTYSEDLKNYQNRALALANIEVYTHGAIGINGFDDLIFSYTSGELEGTLTQQVLLTKVFGTSSGTTSEEILLDIEGALRAGEALDLLGETIIDKDNPSSTTITSDDGLLILLSCMINNIVDLSMDNNSQTMDDVLDKLVDGIMNNDFDPDFITFPQDDGSPDSSLTTMERYLGVGGALAYTASDFTLPSVSLFGGNE